jgi:hypothetical protein
MLGRFGATPVASGDAPDFTDPEVLKALRFYLMLLRDCSPHTRLEGYTPSTNDGSARKRIKARRGDIAEP